MKLSKQALMLCLTIMTCPAVQAHEEILYDMLLQNKAITRTQYDSLIRTGKKAPDRPLPSESLMIYKRLLDNGIITKAQYEKLLAEGHPAPTPAIPVIPEKARDGLRFSGRLSVAPLLNEHQVLHLGVSGAYQVPRRDDEVQFQARPEAHADDTRLVSAGQIKSVDH